MKRYWFGIATFALQQGSSREVIQRLSERNILVKQVPSTNVVDGRLTPEDYNAMRFSTHIFNSEADIDRLAEALAQK